MVECLRNVNSHYMSTKIINLCWFCTVKYLWGGRDEGNYQRVRANSKARRLFITTVLVGRAVRVLAIQPKGHR